MSLLLALLLFQTDEELDRIAERVNKAAELGDNDPERWKAGRAAKKAGPAVLKHLAARFPGLKTVHGPGCGSAWVDPEYHTEIIRVMISFGEAAVPHLTAFLKDADPQKRSMAAFVLKRLPSKGAVAPLIESLADARKDVADRARESLELATFRKLPTADDYRKWHAKRLHQSRAEWLVDAIDENETDPLLRRWIVESVPALLSGRSGLAPLLSAYVDKGWDDARIQIYLRNPSTRKPWSRRSRTLGTRISRPGSSSGSSPEISVPGTRSDGRSRVSAGGSMSPRSSRRCPGRKTRSAKLSCADWARRGIPADGTS